MRRLSAFTPREKEKNKTQRKFVREVDECCSQEKASAGAQRLLKKKHAAY